MYVIKLPFPVYPYLSKLEKAYRARHQAICKFNEAALGSLFILYFLLKTILS
jgi:hypothetical protein